MAIILGCIADDLTGATDLAMILVKEGMKTVQIVGVPDQNTAIPDADAVVIALKSRTIPIAEAVEMSVQSCEWLKAAGAKQVFFKYCSTFDSTAEGNIGPVTDALLENLDTNCTIACPAFPENGRSIYNGYLFVNDGLLSESSLRNHPLTPMRDSNLKRVLEPQTSSTVKNITYDVVDRGSKAIFDELGVEDPNTATVYIIDALEEVHLRYIGQACRNLKLITGGSAVAMGLPENYRNEGFISDNRADGQFSSSHGGAVVLSGSCSEATRAQVEHAKSLMPSYQLNVLDIINEKPVVSDIIEWAKPYIMSETPILIFSSQAPEQVQQTQKQHGRLEVGEKVEVTLGTISRELRALGARNFIVAGGESSGAVISALNVKAMEIGPAIDPGVPWTKGIGSEPLTLALKSGNFGSVDFFSKAIKQLETLKDAA